MQSFKDVVLNSAIRDTTHWPNPSHFKLKTNQTYRGVQQIALIRAMIPNTEYTVNQYNHNLRVTTGGQTYTIELTHKFYTGTSMTTELMTKINTAVPGLLNNVSYDSTRGKYLFDGTAEFKFDFTAARGFNNCHELIGFADGQIYGSDVSNNLWSANVIDLTATRAYLVQLTAGVSVGEVGNISFATPPITSFDANGIRLQTDRPMPSLSLAMIQNSVEPGAIIMYEPSSEYVDRVSMPGGKTFNEFEIRIFRSDGFEADFNGVNNQVTLRLYMTLV